MNSKSIFMIASELIIIVAYSGGSRCSRIIFSIVIPAIIDTVKAIMDITPWNRCNVIFFFLMIFAAGIRIHSRLSFDKNSKNILAGLRISNRSSYSSFNIIEDKTVMIAFVRKIAANPTKESTS